MSTEYYHIRISKEDYGDGWIEYDKLIEHSNFNVDLFSEYIQNIPDKNYISFAIIKPELYSKHSKELDEHYDKVFVSNKKNFHREIELFEQEFKVQGFEYFECSSAFMKYGESYSLHSSPDKNEYKGNPDGYTDRSYIIPVKTKGIYVEKIGYKQSMGFKSAFYNEFDFGYYYGRKEDVIKALEYLYPEDYNNFKRNFVDSFEEGKSVFFFC